MSDLMDCHKYPFPHVYCLQCSKHTRHAFLPEGILPILHPISRLLLLVSNWLYVCITCVDFIVFISYDAVLRESI